MSPATLQRQIAHFQGRVQGVGFRYTTRAIAARHAVTGYVQNLADGRVLVVCEGIPSEIDRFLAEVRAELDRYISAVEAVVDTPRNEFDEFTIRH